LMLFLADILLLPILFTLPAHVGFFLQHVICRAELLYTFFCQLPDDHEPQNSHPETCHHWNGAPEWRIWSWTANPLQQAAKEAESAPCSK
ncbi:hypothetical protein HGM15179_000795, partial [Zosterops borbonicus]